MQRSHRQMPKKVKKTEQVNIRLTPKGVEDIDRIAEAEHRNRTELIRFLVEWSIAQYDQVGSLRSLLTSKVIIPKK
jgi:Ribbon-helix-helix protein, copG family